VDVIVEFRSDESPGVKSNRMDFTIVWRDVLRTWVWRLYGVHGHSGAEQGLGGKDLASAYVLCPLEWQSSYFRVGRS
jgi:hypothetical protein